MTVLGRSRESRFFARHPRTYPKERCSLFGAPKTFGAPFTQNDIVNCERNIQTRY
jgi:hypothetical protein